jgi:hypothetical protein
VDLAKPLFLKRAGHALIIVGLVFLTLMITSDALAAPRVVIYSYLLLGLGIVLVVANKVKEWMYHRKLRGLMARCPKCGWRGDAETCYSTQACPECDSEEIALYDPVVN